MHYTNALRHIFALDTAQSIRAVYYFSGPHQTNPDLKAKKKYLHTLHILIRVNTVAFQSLEYCRSTLVSPVDLYPAVWVHELMSAFHFQ